MKNAMESQENKLNKLCLNFLLLLLLSFTLISTGCSKKANVDDDADIDTASMEADVDDEEFSENEAALEDDTESATAESSAAPLIDEEASSEEQAEYAKSADGEYGIYQVQKGDTLMIISFNVYSDYSKWRDLAELNGLSGGSSLQAGTEVKYRASWEKLPSKGTGSPYLIKHEDTLGTISNDFYGSVKKWKVIWNNNKVLITNPNLIFSGFTVYVPASDEVAMNDQSDLVNLN